MRLDRFAKSMIDFKTATDMAQQVHKEVLALQEKLTDRETRLKAMEKAYFEKVVEVDRLKQKLESLEAKV